MASIWTTADRDAVKSAYLQALTTGYASVTVAGETVESHDPDKFAKLLDRIQADLSQSQGNGGMRIVTLKPAGCG